MATRTITAMFNSRAEAERAIQALASQPGIDRDAVHLGSGSQANEQEGFLSSLKSLFVPDEDRSSYAEGMRRGGALVTAQVEETHLDGAMDVLEQHGAVDLDEREAEWRKSGWTGSTAAAGAPPRPGHRLRREPHRRGRHAGHRRLRPRRRPGQPARHHAEPRRGPGRGHQCERRASGE